MVLNQNRLVALLFSFAHMPPAEPKMNGGRSEMKERGIGIGAPSGVCMCDKCWLLEPFYSPHKAVAYHPPSGIDPRGQHLNSATSSVTQKVQLLF